MAHTLDSFVEAFKMKFNYGVIVQYGWEMGVDDFGDPLEERPVQVYGYPVGCLGGARIGWVGTRKLMETYDLDTAVPVKVSNPPTKEQLSKPGLYVWGESADRAIENWSKR